LIAIAAFAPAIALAGCGADITQPWFAKPMDISGRSAGYSFSELSETRKEQRPITQNDLVDASGACPAASVATVPAAAPAAAGPSPAAPGSDASTLVTDGGVALGMSECAVVSRAGQPSSVQIGSSPAGDRTAVLTFNSGPRAGIYRFQRGGLIEMDAVAAPPAPPPQVAKKKPAKPKKAASN
jgi:hypothetical protein